jgi:deoxyribodipyrimidine photolyase-related protein
MKDIFIILPIHLFYNIDNLINKHVYIIEEPRYFTDFKYHKLKLAYHRATMKKYNEYLQDNNIHVTYIDFQDTPKFYSKKIKNKIFIYEIGDNILENKLKDYYPDIIILPSLNFLINKQLVLENKHIFYKEKTGKYNFMNFYKWQRKRLNILMQDNKPLNGKWNYDSENRSKLPKNLDINENLSIIDNTYTCESIKYINKHFPNNYGSLDNFIYPIDHESTLKHLKKFLKNKFENFGKYEDAISNKYNFIFHSVISPMMNIGLITDELVIKYILKYQNKISFNNIEAIIRQIIGWRNYMYTIYLLEGDIKSNFLNHNNLINKDILWKAETGIQPVDDAMKQLINYGYTHHIIRLMVLGNFLLLCQIHPDQVYELFMEWSIDGYAWTMMTNIYGMSQYADGGKIMTRLYFSSSNYIIKMSNYKKTEKWTNIFDSLYYKFIDKHKLILEKNYATATSVKLLNKKKDIKRILEIGDAYIDTIII